MIRLYLLDGSMMDSRENLHSHLYMQFALPEHYGRNLDALWDCLTEKTPGCIVIQRAESADPIALSHLLRVLLDLVRRDARWEIQLSTGDPDCHAHGAPEEGEPPVCTGDCKNCTIAAASAGLCEEAPHRSLDDSDDIFG